MSAASRTRLAPTLGALIAAAAVLLTAGAAALLPNIARASDGFYLTGLRVAVEGSTWHADNRFLVEWDGNPPGSEPVHFAVRDAAAQPIPGFGVSTTTEPLFGGLRVPPVPGIYLFEAWDQKAGIPGPPVRVPLYFDDARPAPLTITAPAWVAAGSAVTAWLSHPAVPLPISGIEGYAVTLDAQADGRPCARADRCGPAEVDLPRGIGDDTIEFPTLPEGVSFIHAVAVSNSGMASSAVATTPVGVDGTPPQVRLDGVPDGWSPGPVRVTAVAVDPLSGMAPSGPSGPLTALAVDGAPPQTVPGSTASATVAGEGVHRVDFYGRDAIGNSGDGSLPFAHPGSATVRIDESGPTVRFVAGDPGDPERIEATVADPLSGPDPDRGLVEVRRVGSSSRFQPLPTDARRDRLVARWSSDDFPRGAYEFRATGFDTAGNSATSALGPGGAPFVLQDPVKREARLAFGFGAGQLVLPRCSRTNGGRRCRHVVVRSFAKRPPARTVPCCHGAVVGGRLLDAAGEPLAGQTVEVVETFPGGARNADRRTTLTTDADGRFSTRLAPGPSREITAEFAGTARLTRVAGRLLRLGVRAGVHLRVSTGHVAVGGAPVVFSGRIDHPEARLPANGLPVELEFRLPGMPWTEFRTVQSDRSGHFRYPYSFSDDDSAGVRFLFRAFVAETGDWPFAPAISRPLAVIG